MTRKFFATLALLMAFCMNVLGQKITGVILDASTGDSLSLAGVTYKERKVSAIADLDGIFSIARINGATLTFSCMGYKDETVNITKATPSRLTIKLKPDTKQLGEVVCFFCVPYFNFLRPKTLILLRKREQSRIFIVPNSAISCKNLYLCSRLVRTMRARIYKGY